MPEQQLDDFPISVPRHLLLTEMNCSHCIKLRETIGLDNLYFNEAVTGLIATINTPNIQASMLLVRVLSKLYPALADMAFPAIIDTETGEVLGTPIYEDEWTRHGFKKDEDSNAVISKVLKIIVPAIKPNKHHNVNE